MNAVDTNILAYCIDSESPAKATRAGAFVPSLQPGSTLLLWQVVVELGAVITRWHRLGKASDEAYGWIEDLLAEFPLAVPTASVATDGLGLYRAHKLQYFDALIIASCRHAGATTLYSEDLPGIAGAEVEGVRIVNPFS